MESLPAPAVMYRALVSRDEAFEGVFFVGVKTTGVFCRPTCTARKPLAKNVEYFRSASEALHAGYRACARCHPLEAAGKPTEMLRQLMLFAERANGERLRDADLRRAGIEPAAARRAFLRHCGMTFHAYTRARRIGASVRVLQNGRQRKARGGVLAAAAAAGFRSESGYREAASRLLGSAPSKAVDAQVLSARTIATPLGAMIAVASGRGVHLLEFSDRRALEREMIVLRKRLKAVVLPDAPQGRAHLDLLERELAGYFRGELRVFSVPTVEAGSPFALKVWKQLKAIPPGETRSYIDLARKLGSPGASRAVGRANGSNCIAIVIPCHRVVNANGELGGYGGGVWRKRRLLEIEAGTS